MRRRLLALLVVASVVLAGGPALAVQHSGGDAAAGAVDEPTTDSYVLEYGDQCQPIEPLRTSGTVEAFYDYRNHETHPEGVDRMYSSYGTTHLQENDASIMFLHEGTDGMSLVAVHDRVDGNSSGGMASVEYVGLPPSAEWVVRDDYYDGESNMVEWHDEDGWLGADWIWAHNRTDGGAINGGLNDAFAVTVHPAFNDDAAFAGADEDELHDPDYHDDGEIDEWQVLSGDAGDPDRTTLPSLDQPVTLRTGTCDDPSVSHDRTDGGIETTVADAAPDDVVQLQPTRGTGDDARFDAVGLAGLGGDATYAFSSQQADDLPALPDGNESLSHLTVAGDGVPADGSATVSFGVDAARLNDAGVGADAVSLFAYDGAEWTEAPTDVVDESGTVQFESEVASLESLAIAYEEPEEDGSAFPMSGFGLLTGVAAVLSVAVLRAVRVVRE